MAGKRGNDIADLYIAVYVYQYMCFMAKRVGICMCSSHAFSGNALADDNVIIRASFSFRRSKHRYTAHSSVFLVYRCPTRTGPIW